MQTPAYFISRHPSAYRMPSVRPAGQLSGPLPFSALAGIASFNPLAESASVAAYQASHPGQPASLTETGGPSSASASLGNISTVPTGGETGVANILPGTNQYITGGTSRTGLIVGAIAVAAAVGTIAYFATRRRRR